MDDYYSPLYEELEIIKNNPNVFDCINVLENNNKILKYLNLKGKILGIGSSRCTFAFNKYWVLKVPSTTDGCYHNILEFIINYVVQGPLARCTLYWYKGIPYIFMERVVTPCPIHLSNSLYLIDGSNQYGMSVKRKVPVYFDYGHEEHLVLNTQEYFEEILKNPAQVPTKERLTKILSKLLA